MKQCFLVNDLLFYAPKPAILVVFGHFHFVSFFTTGSKILNIFRSRLHKKKLAILWKYHPWYQAGWIMSLISHDMDNDGDLDVLASDRRSKTPGILWLENPGIKAMRANLSLQWNVHRIGAVGKEVMFITISKDNVIHAAVRSNRIHLLRSNADPRKPWREQVITYPSNKYGTAKAARAADLDGDGRTEIAVSCEAANGAKSGVFYLKQIKGKWVDHDIGGPEGLKYDRIEL